MGSFSLVHWAILLVVVVLVFGTSKLKSAGKDLGGAVKGFKDAVKDENTAHSNKHRVLNHETDTATQPLKSGDRVDEVQITSPIAEDKHNV